jgi:GntR family transcriptional regulator/MocR family aminotransferase
MRNSYRARRDALVDALTLELPEARIEGIAAGLHVTLRLPEGDDEHAIRLQAAVRRIAIETLSEYTTTPSGDAPALLIGYAQMPEPAIRAGVALLAEAVRAARS